MSKTELPRPQWTPKRPEVPAQCASCPFRTGNNAEFGAVMSKLSKREGGDGKLTTGQLVGARIMIMDGCMTMGDFACHGTVYTPDMQKRPEHEWMQCKGATDFYRANETHKLNGNHTK